MRRWRWLSLAMVAWLASCGGPPPADYVVIDTKEPAFTVFRPAPKVSEILLHRLVAEQGAGGTLRVVPWADLPAAVRAEAPKVVRRDDFPGEPTLPGLLCLLRKAPGSWGLTWNGGLAITRNDYDYARRSFAAQSPPATPSPVEPRAQMASFGCP